MTSFLHLLPSFLLDESYEQALEAVKIGKLKVIQAGVPFDRPDDYFAEMIKSDQHMFKVLYSFHFFSFFFFFFPFPLFFHFYKRESSLIFTFFWFIADLFLLLFLFVQFWDFR